MSGSERMVRRDSRLFGQLCCELLGRGSSVRFRVNGKSMSPNLLDGDEVVIVMACAEKMHRGDVVLAENAEGFCVHRVSSLRAGNVILRSDTGHDFDPPTSRVLGKVLSRHNACEEESFTAFQTRIVHPLRVELFRLRVAASSRLRSLAFAVGAIIALAFACATFLAPAANAQTADLQLTQTPSSTAVDSAAKSLGTASTVTWTGGVASFTFPTPLSTGAFVGAPLTTTGFTPSGYNLTSAPITAVNTTTGVVSVSLPAPSMGTATSATWAGNVASFTFPTPLPSFAVVGAQLTTTGFTPAAYNVTNAAITSVNTTTGVVTVALANQSLGTATNATWAGGTATIRFASLPSEAVVGNLLTTTGFRSTGTGSYNVTNAPITGVTGTSVQVAVAASPGTLQADGTGTVSPNSPATTQGTGTVNPTTSTTNGTGSVPNLYSYSEVVVNNSSSASVTSGTIIVYMQTPPNSAFAFSSGTNWTCTGTAGSQGPVICTYNAALASGGTASTLTVTFEVNPGTTYGTTIQASATVTNNSFTDTKPSNNTSLSSIIVESASASDLALTMSVSPTPVFVSSNFAYTIQVQNLGQATAAATTNVFTDTLPSGLTNVTASATGGWTCSGTTTVSCSSASMAMNASVTITITATAPVNATTLTNTATVSLSGDPNSANNSATAYTVVQPIACATPGRDGALAAPTTSTVVNAYYPPSNQGTLASASTSVTLGAAAAAPGAQTAIASGDLLLIIQTQGATINATNTSSYGHGVPGDPAAGQTSTGSSGLFEFVTATGAVPVTGGPLTFSGTGPTGGLLNSYSYATPSYVSQTATAATWSGNVATFTLGALPASTLPYTVLTTTGFTPAVYNINDAPILSVNTSTGVVTVALNLTTNPGAATTLGSGAVATQGQQTYQVIRVPQYVSAILSSNLTVLPWNGSVGGVLALDVASQLTLGGTVALDTLGFRGGGAQLLSGPAIGGTDLPTDYVTYAPSSNTTTTGANGAKGEGIAGTPRWVAPVTITTTSVPVDAYNGTLTDSLPGGSMARGAPGNAGGGGTDGDPPGNDYNSGGGGGGNGGTGGQGGYGWNSMTSTNTTDGGFGGVTFNASTSALVMGGGGGGGTSNNGTYCVYNASNGTCTSSGNATGNYSSGGYGGGIVIIHAGSVVGTGSITSNGETTLSTLNDSTGGGGAGGSILVFANSGGLSGLTVSANGGAAGNAWPIEAPGGFPGERHGPGGGGAGGVIFLSSSPKTYGVNGGLNGFTDTVSDSYGSTPGTAGVLVTTDIITETPGTQSGAYCGGADLTVTNSVSPTLVQDSGTLTYTQTVTNNGPLDAVNAVFSESIPANTTFASVTPPAGGNWTCNTPVTTVLTCTNADVAASSSGTFTVTVTVGSTVPNGTQITDVDNITSGSYDPNLSNNSATAVSTVTLGTQADLAVTNTPSAPSVVAGGTFTMTSVVTNNGPATVTGAVFTEPNASVSTTIGATTYTFNAKILSYTAPAGWTCGLPAGGIGTATCYPTTLTAGSSGTIVFTEQAPTTSTTPTTTQAVPAGTVISATANINSGVSDPNYANNSATGSIEIANTGQADLAVTASGTPNPVVAGGTISYAQTVTNNGPTAITAGGTTPSVTFTDVIPTNTTLVSYTTPSGWTCGTTTSGTPAVTTLTCTLNSGQTLAVGANVNIPVVVKVNAGTAGGTVITNSPTVSSSVSDPISSNNTATVNTTVASPTQAYVTISKSASPEPVNQNTNLTYTVVVTNNGPAVATGVTVSDPIDSTLTYASSSASQGTCTYTSSTVTVSCSLGSLSVGSTATITINATATNFGTTTATTCNGATTTYTTCNVAYLSTTTSNPNTTGCTGATPVPNACVASTIQATTSVNLDTFGAFQQPDGSVRVVWHTLEESRNLGFHIYREDATGQHRMDASLIAGSALILRASRPQHAAKWYAWVDAHPVPGASYWIQDVDVGGTRAMHGPAAPESISSAPSSARGVPVSMRTLEPSPALSQLRANVVAASPVSGSGAAPRPMLPPLLPPAPVTPPAPSSNGGFNVADYPAVLISVDQEGWYHVPFAQLFAAGLNPSTNVSQLHLYVEGAEIPILLVGHSSGAAAPTDAVEFYGAGIDTPFSGTRVYWLLTESSNGLRVALPPVDVGSGDPPENFAFTTMREDRTTYFAALLNGENSDNFFGDIVTTDPVDETLTVIHPDTSSSQPLTLTVALQGASDQQFHSVSVQFNGNNVGTMNFYNEILASQSFTVAPSQLVNGTNNVTLMALEGDNDVSLVQSVQLTYAHTYTADSDWLRATAPSSAAVQIGGFTNPAVRVFDISNPLQIVELKSSVSVASGAFSVSTTIPAGMPLMHTILAVAQDTLAAPLSVAGYKPAFLEDQRTGADIVIITHPDFAASLSSLVSLRNQQGYSVLQVTTDQLFNQFNYGERSPFAIQTFLQEAATQWQHKPQAVLLVGDASMDPRNYLGFGDFDFVPTRIVETQAFKTASDDWFTDFQQTGYPTIPIGRLPVRTVADLDLVISKIVGYETGQYAGTWNNQALLIADQNVEANFTAATLAASAALPPSLQTTQILTDGMDQATAESTILQALNEGALIVDYNGHGAEQQWSFDDIFDDNTAASLTNGGRLPVYLLIDCLNGLFQDVYAQSLAKSLILAPNGGAVAVWASSGYTSEPPQSSMELALLNELAANPNEILGLAILHAKQQTTDSDVRRTWIWFGDPATRLNYNGTATVPGIPRTPPNRPVTIRQPRQICPGGAVCGLERR
jgi:uncharacterized repeat protein (TIGR01451 family)